MVVVVVMCSRSISGRGTYMIQWNSFGCGRGSACDRWCASVNDPIGIARTSYCGISIFGIVSACATHGCACVHDRFTIWVRSRGPTIVELVGIGSCECVRHNTHHITGSELAGVPRTY